MTCLHCVYIIETPDQKIKAWHDSITLQTHPKIKIGVQYIRNTCEYIPMLQLHQDSLLTRKVFYWHNLSAQFFFSVSSGSSSSHLHRQVIFIKSGSSLDLDHHWIWIITAGSSWVLSLDSSLHRKFYRASPFSCWMYIYRTSPFSYWMYHHRASPFSY